MTTESKPRAERVLLVASYAPSLITFRGPLIAALVAAGHDVVAAAPCIDATTAESVRQLGATPRLVEIRNTSLNPWTWFKSFRALAKLIRDTRPGVVIAYTIQPVILAALLGRIKKVPRTVALITGLGFAFTVGGGMRRAISRVFASILYRLALSRADIVLFQNPDDQALFKKLGLLRDETETAIINGSGVDVDHFSQAPVPPDLSFLMIARLLGDKGIREFVRASAELKSKHPEVSISLIGYRDASPDAIRESELHEIIASGIRFLGKVEDVRPALVASSVYVLPSFREGTPRSVLEALAVGRAIITSDAPGCRETVQDGVNGFLVPPRDAEALYQAMVKFVEDPSLARPMGAASRRIAEDKYDVRKVNADLMRHAGL